MKWSRIIPARFALSLSVHLTPTLKTCEITFYKQTKIVQAQFVFICYFFTGALKQKRMQIINLYDMIYLGFWTPPTRWLPGLGSRVPLLGSRVLGPTFRVLGLGSHLWNGSQVSGPDSQPQGLGSGVLAPTYEMSPGSRVSGLRESLASRVSFFGYAIKVTLLKNL